MHRHGDLESLYYAVDSKGVLWVVNLQLPIWLQSIHSTKSELIERVKTFGQQIEDLKYLPPGIPEFVESGEQNG